VDAAAGGAAAGAHDFRSGPSRGNRLRRPQQFQRLDSLAEWQARNGVVFWRRLAHQLVKQLSLAKPITALAVGRAIMLGKIRSLDQPVADFVDEWKDDPLRAKILVRHLLDMRAGFLRQASRAEPGEIMARSFLHPRSDAILIREYPVVDEPGSRYEYNNAASAMVAILIERATGRRYAEFVGTEILQKIGAQGGKAWVNREGGVANSGCCMLLPAETFLRLAILTLRDGVWDGQRLLPESYVADMTRPTAENPYYGLAVYVAGRYTERRGPANPDLPLPKTLHSEPYLAADLFLFDGNMNQVVYIIPSQDLAILRTGRAPPRSEDTEWDNAYLPNLIMRGIVSEGRSSAPQPR
jgi:CubicO group peptidase (beta-lactamase class C family)